MNNLMSMKDINQCIKAINNNLHTLDRVLNGFVSTMEYFNFSENFDFLVSEISRPYNLTNRNKDILGHYYSMCQELEFEYEKWDLDNYETHPDYEKINSMYEEIYNSCNTKIINFLKTYDSENIQFINLDDNEPLTISSYIQEIQVESKSLRKRIYESINIKPGMFGISIDVKNLFRKK